MSGKIPGADKLDTAELCINLKDQKLYSKDVDGNVFELGGKVDSGITPPPGPGGNNIGDLFWDGDFLLVWNGNEWVPVGAADLDYTPAPDKGTITNTAGDDVDLPLVDDTNAGLMSPDEHKKLDGMPVIISGDQFPGTPELGDIWIDTNLCPPSINIWNDCEDPGNPDWTPIGGGDPTGCQQGGVAIAGDTEIGSTLTATGGRGLDAGELLPEPTYNWTGPNGFTATGTEIVATEEGNYTVTATVTCIDGTNLETSATKTISDSYVDMVNNTPPVIAVVGELPDGAYSGNNLYVVTPATVINGDNPVIVENQWYRDGAKVETEQLYTISAADPEGSVLTCRQLFRDARTNEILSDASNDITIVARPADAITFTPVITDDGTDQGNTVGRVLTASALNIQGGTAAIEYEFEWLVGGLMMGTNKTLNLVDSFVGKVVVCNITVAEPDGSNPETRPATYDKIIEVAGTINTPTVLGPLNGDDYSQIETRNLISDSITKIEGGGMHPCSTELIENVDQTIITTYTTKLFGARNTLAATTPDICYNDTPTAGNGDSGIFTDTYGVQPSAVDPNVAQVKAFDVGTELEHVRFGRFTGDQELIAAYKLYGTNDPNAKWSTLPLLDSSTGSDGKEYLDSGDTPYRYFIWWGNDQGDGTNAGFTISSFGLVSPSAAISSATLTFPSNKDFDCFEPGDVVQGFDEEPLTSYTLWNSIDETMMDRLSDSPTDDTGDQKSLWKPNVSFNSFINGDTVWSGSPETINPGDAPSAHNPRHANFYDMGKPVNHLEWARPVGDISSSFSVYATNDPDDVNSWVKVRHNSMIYQATNANGIRSGNTDYRYYCFHIDATWNSASYVLLPDSYASDEKVKVISKTDEAPWEIVVDGGKWKGTDDSGEQGQNTGNPAWNETRVWSEIIQIVTIASTSDIKDLFDGNLNTGIGSTDPSPGSVFQIIIPADIPGSTISAQASNSVNQMNFSLDGVNYVNKGETLELPEGDRILYIKGIGANTATCGAIYIDGLILVDALIAPGQEKLTKKTPYDTKLTVSGGKDLEDMVAGDPMVMSDGTPPGGAYTRKPYKLVTTDIESVNNLQYSAQPTSGVVFNNSYTWASCFTSPLDVNGAAAATSGGNVYSIDLTATPITILAGNKVKIYCVSSTGKTDEHIFLNNQKLSTFNPTRVDDGWGGASTFAYEFTASSEFDVTGCGVTDTMRFCGLELNGSLVFDGRDNILTFPGDVSTNPDLQYFKAGDVLQGSEFAQVGDPYQHKVHNNDTLGGYPNTYLSDTLQTIGTAPASTPVGTVVTGVFDKPVYGFFEWLEPFNPDLPNAGGTISYQMLAYWSGSSWILNAKFYGPLNTEPNNVLEGTVAAEVWASMRTDQVTFNTYSIGDTLPFNTSVSDPYNTAKFGFDANAGAIVRVISNGYDLDPKQNTLTVDGGDWDRFGNEIWSDRLTTTYNGGNMLIASDRAFNGTFADYAHGGVGAGVVMTFDGTGITVNTSLRVNIVTGTEPNPPTVSANGGTEYPYPQKDGASVGANSGEWVDLNFTGDLSKIEFKTQGTQNGLYLYGIEIDGILLIDSTGGATHVEYQTIGGMGKLVATNTDDNTIMLSDDPTRYPQ